MVRWYGGVAGAVAPAEGVDAYGCGFGCAHSVAGGGFPLRLGFRQCFSVFWGCLGRQVVMEPYRTERLRDLTDESARMEARRLVTVVVARRRMLDSWFGVTSPEVVEYCEDSGFAAGMLALFRYARGEAVPGVLVEDFLGDFLTLMFCGVASGAMALPSFRRMGDRPWALAWRAAELRLALASGEDLDVTQFAHLMCVGVSEVQEALALRGVEVAGGMVPHGVLVSLVEALSGGEAGAGQR